MFQNPMHAQLILKRPRTNMLKITVLVDRNLRPDICSNEQRRGYKEGSSVAPVK